MRRRRFRSERRPAEWGVRLLLAAGIGLVGYHATADALGYVLRNRAPERARTLSPRDGRTAGALAAWLLATGKPADRPRAAVLARTALREDPTVVAAVSTLGLVTQLGGDTARAERLFAYAQRLSRRDLPTQLWALENAVGRGDIAGALRHYDIALRTSSAAPAVLFPVLTGAIGEPAIRAALVKAYRTRPPWGGAFIEYLTGNGRDPRASADLFTALHRAGVPIYSGSQAILINSLLANGFADDAWRYYASVRPGADRRRSRDPKFLYDSTLASPFDWVPINDGASATVQRGERGGVFDFAVPASVGGPLLRQAQLLPPGEYVLRGRSRDIDQAEEARPYWALTCSDGRELGRVAVPNSAAAGGAFMGRFTVPAGCPAQTLTLVARPSDRIGGVTGQLDFVELVPAR